MLKKYFYMFFPAFKKKWKNTPTQRYSNDFSGKKISRKYKKRKKNIFQKASKKISFFWNFPSWITALILWIAFVLVCIYVLFYSPYTNISKINVYREWALIDINRAYSILDYLRGKNLLSSDSKSIAQRLQKSQSSISEIRINKDFPDSINIYLDSYDVIFQTDNYFILENWSISLKENEDFPDAQFIYLSQDVSEYLDFQKNLDIEQLGIMSKTIEEANKNILGFTPTQIYYYITEREVLIKDNSWTIYIFDLERDIDNQIKRIAIYDTESTENKRDSYVYIDVRISDKLFLCGIENEVTCNNNLQQIYWNTIFQSPLPELSESQQ